MTPVRVKGGNVNRRIPLQCGNAPLMFPRFARSDDDHCNAYRLRINSDIRRLLAEHPNASIRLQIFARHEVSSVGKVFGQRYYHPSSEVIVGSFVRGQALTLIPESREDRVVAELNSLERPVIPLVGLVGTACAATRAHADERTFLDYFSFRSQSEYGIVRFHPELFQPPSFSAHREDTIFRSASLGAA